MTGMASPERRIDHLVLAVHDLDAAAAGYARLGFQVGARNRHPWGTENRLVQFGSSFLELITVGQAADVPPHRPGAFSFGAFVADYLRTCEGLAMLVLDSPDAAADAAAFARAGIGDFEPFFFERSGSRPDGSTTHVAFSLAFACDPGLPDAAFFVCQQHYPDAFWTAGLQEHDNGARDVTEVTLTVDDPADHDRFLAAFTGRPASPDGRRYAWAGGGALAVAARPGLNRLTGFSIAVPDLDAVTVRLVLAAVPFDRSAGMVSIDARHGFGVRIDFVLAGR